MNLYIFWTITAFQILRIPYNNANNPEKRLLLTLVLTVATIPGNQNPLGSRTRRVSRLSPREKAQKTEVGEPLRCHLLSRRRILIPPLSASPLSAQQLAVPECMPT